MKIIQPEAHILPMTGDVLKHVERCGRIAYKSEDAITEDSHVKFIKHLIQRGHESVLEHGNYVFMVEFFDYQNTKKIYDSLCFEAANELGYSARLRFSGSGKPNERNIISGNIRAWRDFIRLCRLAGVEVPKWINNTFCSNIAFHDLSLDGKYKDGYKPAKREDLIPEEQRIHWTETAHFITDRSISHELVRHRALSPTQESQRYVNYSKGRFGGEITFIEPLWVTDGVLRKLWEASAENDEAEYMALSQYGLQPQQARKVLPNSAKTEVVMTGTIGEWVHFFGLRDADDADPEMRRIAKPLHGEFSENYAI
ncbi:MAG: FAD-dependent thymidylate synthase [Peptococcaceae bacterium]|nr:FAD-dependent thymidylate synthase [Peptococcaceae bacterium]